MTFHIKILRKAESDIRNITHYLQRRSPQGANAWINALQNALNRLRNDAEGCSAALENEHFDIEIKQQLFKTRKGNVYRLVFTIVADEARILRVRGTGQAPITPDDIY